VVRSSPSDDPDIGVVGARAPVPTARRGAAGANGAGRWPGACSTCVTVTSPALTARDRVAGEAGRTRGLRP